MDIIKGSDLMLFVKRGNVTKSLAFATSHNFSISADTSDISTKDHGFWGAKEVTRITWNIQTDNLYTVDEFNSLYDLMIARQAIPVYFTLKTPTERQGIPATVNLPGDTQNTWHMSTASGEEGYYGLVYITSLSANAAAGDNATFSATFDGIGAITKGLPGQVESMASGGGGSSINHQSYSGTVTTTTYNKVDTAQTAYDSSADYYIYDNGDFVKVEITESKYSSNELVIYTKGTTTTETVDTADNNG